MLASSKSSFGLLRQKAFLLPAVQKRSILINIEDVTEGPNAKTLVSFNRKPFLDCVQNFPHEFLNFNFTEKAEEILKPRLLRNSQAQIINCHHYKNTSFSKFFKKYYDETEPEYYWAYGVPEVFKELRKQSGPLTSYNIFFGYWLFLLSKGYINYDDIVDTIIITTLPFSLVYHFFHYEYKKYLLQLNELHTKRIQDILDLPAACYKRKIDFYDGEIDFNYVKLMLADMDNEFLKIQKEIQYREYLKLKHDEFKKRLDYQVELSMLENNFETNLLRSWIIPQIENSITPQLKSDVLQQCLSHLQNLAYKSQNIQAT